MQCKNFSLAKRKNIAISELNYRALRRLGCVGDTFDDVVSEILGKIGQNDDTRITNMDSITTSRLDMRGESDRE